MIMFLYNLFVTGVIWFFFILCCCYAVAHLNGIEAWGKEKYTEEYNKVKDVTTDFLYEFAPAEIGFFKKHVNKFAIMLFVLVILSPFFTIGSLIAAII